MTQETQALQHALAQFDNQLKGYDHGTRAFFASLASPTPDSPAEQFLMQRSKSVELDNRRAKFMRGFDDEGRPNIRKSVPHWNAFADTPELKKAALDVGTLTNFANVTGGQSLAYFSLDTRLARGTIRPSSATLYQALHKSRANQVVDFWAYIDSIGGAPPGSAGAAYSSQTGALNINSGSYQDKLVNLTLMVDARAITMSLAAQNSFIDIADAETGNAALSLLQTADWDCYFGNNTLYGSQFTGIANVIPTTNVLDFFGYTGASGNTVEQNLFNAIYEFAGHITSFGTFGRTTHAFMSPVSIGGLQTLITTLLNNVVVDITQMQASNRGIVVNGDLQGMQTSFGEIGFAKDLLITARDVPVVALAGYTGTASSPTPVTSVTPTASGAAFNPSNWSGAYVATGTPFVQYAVASADGNMNESTLTWSSPVSGVTALGAYSLAIAPANADSTAFRVFRSGLLPSATNVSGNVHAIRYIGTIAANGSSTVTFIDANGAVAGTQIPGSQTIFLLDLDEEDAALDYRYLLPMTKVNLFAGNIYMPWAVAQIGAIRARVPKYHGLIKNVVLSNVTTGFSPFNTNLNITSND